MAVQMTRSLKAASSVDNNTEDEKVEFDFTCDSLVSYNLFNFEYDGEFGLIDKEFNSDLSYRINCKRDTINFPEWTGLDPIISAIPGNADLFIDTDASHSGAGNQ